MGYVILLGNNLVNPWSAVAAYIGIVLGKEYVNRVACSKDKNWEKCMFSKVGLDCKSNIKAANG